MLRARVIDALDKGALFGVQFPLGGLLEKVLEGLGDRGAGA